MNYNLKQPEVFRVCTDKAFSPMLYLSRNAYIFWFQCPFNRLVYIFDYNNKKFLGEILTKVSEVNARALNLSTYPQHVIDAALSTYKLTDEEKEDTSLDIITGCQVCYFCRVLYSPKVS